MSNYSEKLKDPRWQKKRLEIMKRDKFACKKCKDTETTLHVHHLEYEYGKEPWEYDNSNFLTLCEDCHRIVKDQCKEFVVDLIVLKLNNWEKGNKIIFYGQTYTTMRMEIYNKELNKICGFNFNNYDSFQTMLKFMKKFL